MVKHTPKYADVNVSDENLAAMIEYAEELEANGNYAAAAQIYSMIPDTAQEAAKGEAKKIIDDTPEKRFADDLGEAREIINDVNGLTED